MELNIWTDPMLPLYLGDDVAVAILRNNSYYVAISWMLFDIRDWDTPPALDVSVIAAKMSRSQTLVFDRSHQPNNHLCNPLCWEAILI